MKQTILATLIAAATILCTKASTSYNIRGTDYEADTLFHALIGPGTTQTSLLMKSKTGDRQMYVYYAIVDFTNPYITLHTVMGHDTYNTGETISSMGKRKSSNGNRYYLGTNGDFFVTGGTTKRGESLVGVPLGPCIADGEIYKGYTGTWFTQFALGADKTTHMGYSTFSGTVTSSTGAQAPLDGVNTDAGNDALTLYNSHYFAGTNQTGSCAEVQLLLANGQTFAVGRPVHMVVASAPSTAGDLDIPAQGYVLHGQGSTYDFINNMKQGDTVTVDLRVLVDGKELIPQEMISSFPRSLQDGKVTDTEYMLEEFGTFQPVTAMGLGDGGKKIYFLTIDGRSTKSSGARTTEIADLLRQLGASDALSFDSGGSSTFWTSALGVRNVPSDGQERADANGIFAVCTAPDDSVIASISFVDWVAKVPKYGLYKPMFYGYNKYGMLIDTNLKGVTITCPEKVGHVKDDSIFVGNGSGTAMLTAHYGELTAAIPVTIEGSIGNVHIALDSVVNDTYHPYTIEVQSSTDGLTMNADPSILSWTSSDERVVTVGHDTGVLQGVADGTAWVIGKVGDVVDSLKVIVEKPLAHVMAIDPNPDVTTWKFTQSGGKNATQQANGDGITYSYTGASSRAPKIVLTKALRLWSLPDTVRLRINPGEASFKNVVFGLRANGQNVAYHTVTPDSVTAGKEMVLDVPTSAWTDATNMANFPVTLNSIQLNMNASTTGKQYTIEFLGFETVYSAVPAAPAAKGDLNADGQVNMTDVTTLINMILGNTAPAAAADLNADGRVNVTDVTTLINIILGTE